MFKYVSAAALTIMILDRDQYYNEIFCKQGLSDFRKLKVNQKIIHFDEYCLGLMNGTYYQGNFEKN